MSTAVGWAGDTGASQADEADADMRARASDSTRASTSGQDSYSAHRCAQMAVRLIPAWCTACTAVHLLRGMSLLSEEPIALACTHMQGIISHHACCPLCRAAFYGHTETLLSLLREWPMEQQQALDPHGNTVLHVAVLRHRYELVQVPILCRLPPQGCLLVASSSALWSLRYTC